MSTTIRTATIADAEILARLNVFVQELHADARPDRFRRTRPDDVAGWYRAVLSQPGARAWVADDPGSPVGYLLALVHERPSNPLVHGRRWCEIDQIAVAPERRRRGIATALVRKAVSAAQDEGIADIEVSSWSFNEAAQSLFQRLGFVPMMTRFELKRQGSAT